MNIDISRSQIDDNLYLVLRTIYHYERSIAGQYGLDYQQIYALQYLRRNADARVTEIAAEMELPMFAASRLIDRLVAGGFLKKVQDTADRRNLHIHFEPKGEEILKAIENASFARITKNLMDLSREEILELMELTEKLPIVLGVTDRVIK